MNTPANCLQTLKTMEVHITTHKPVRMRMSMGKARIAITLDEESIGELDRLANQRVFQSGSQAIQEAMSERLRRMKRSRPAREYAKLQPAFEEAMAEEGMKGLNEIIA